MHDLGGPVGVHWALHRPARVTKLALLNTLRLPGVLRGGARSSSRRAATPELREQLTSPAGLEAAMRLGLADEANLTEECSPPCASRSGATTSRAARSRPRASASSSRASPRSRGELPASTSRSASSTASGTGSCPTSPRRWRACARPAAGGGHRAAGLRALPPGGGGRRDRRGAGRLLRRADRYVGGAAITSTT